MTPHNHRTVVDGCWRCELSADELEPQVSGFECRDILCIRSALMGSYYCDEHDQ